MDEVNLDERMGRLEVMMRQLIDMVGKNNERITAIELRLDKIEERQDRMESRLDRMDSRLDGMEEKQNSMSTHLEEIKNEQGEMSEKVGRIDDAFDQTNFDTLALNKRMFRMESDIERLEQQ